MSRARDTAKLIASSAVLACIAFFFYRAFQLNWASIRAQKLELDYRFLLAAGLCIVVTYLIPTYGWQLTINALSANGKVSFSESVAVVNSASLVKYIPGKIWSYALQMYWLASKGFAKSLVIYVNAINLFISIVASLMLGVALLLPSPDRFPPAITVAALVSLVVVDVIALKFHNGFFRWLIASYNRLAKRQLQFFETPTSLIVQLHLLHLLAALAFGLAAYFICLGIGYPVRIGQAPLLMASLLLSDTIAFAALIVPGGLGVREGLMYAMLGGAASGPMALTLPVAARVMHMIADVILGGTAFRLLRKLSGKAPSGG
jgi:uncharacterized membrane protein YbhN (UPF0104 family)